MEEETNVYSCKGCGTKCNSNKLTSFSNLILQSTRMSDSRYYQTANSLSVGRDELKKKINWMSWSSICKSKKQRS